jgi:Zn-dependent protease
MVSLFRSNKRNRSSRDCCEDSSVRTTMQRTYAEELQFPGSRHCDTPRSRSLQCFQTQSKTRESQDIDLLNMFRVSALKRFAVANTKFASSQSFARFSSSSALAMRGGIRRVPYQLQHRPPSQIILARPFFSRRNEDNGSGTQKLGMLASAGVGLSLLAGKTKYAFVALKLTKAAPALSMVISTLAYVPLFGWTHAVGMVGLIFVHECGHALVLHKFGVPFKPMVFVPFMGAVISAGPMRNAYEDALVAFGGPVLGSAAALGVGMVGVATDSQQLMALADFGYMVNLFNLLPVGMMDGGRIAGAVSPYLGVAGVGVMGAMIYNGMVYNPLVYLLTLAGTYTTAARLFGWSEYGEPHMKNYYKIPGSQQAGIAAGYLTLAVALVLAMRENDKHRKTPKQLKQEQVYGYSEPSPWSVEGHHDGKYDDYFK